MRQQRFGVAPTVESLWAKMRSFPRMVFGMTATPISTELWGDDTLNGDLEFLGHRWDARRSENPFRQFIAMITGPLESLLALFIEEVKRERQGFYHRLSIDRRVGRTLDVTKMYGWLWEYFESFSELPYQHREWDNESKDAKDYEMKRGCQGETKIMVAHVIWSGSKRAKCFCDDHWECRALRAIHSYISLEEE